MRLRHGGIALFLCLVGIGFAQDSSPAATPDKRAFGVLPNYRTAEASLPFAPISARRKLIIASKDSFDGPIYLNTAFFASIFQLEDQNPSYGQGMSGYSKRLAASFGDQMVGNMMTEGVMPSLLHEDPRYFRIGVGAKKSRIAYALTRIFVAKTDSGRNTFNFAEVLGNSGAVALSNLWYPDSRTASENIEKLAVQLVTDAASNVLKEFWPDVKRHFQKKREARASGGLRRATTP